MGPVQSLAVLLLLAIVVSTTAEEVPTLAPTEEATSTPAGTGSTSEPTSEAPSTNTPSQTSTGTPSSTPTSGASSCTQVAAAAVAPSYGVFYSDASTEGSLIFPGAVAPTAGMF